MTVFDDKAIVSKFPARAREKIAGMLMRRTQLRAAVTHCDAQTREAIDRLQQAEAQHRTYASQPGTSAAQRNEIAAKAEELQAIVDDCNAKATTARRQRDEGTATLVDLESCVAFWLRNGITEFPPFDGPAPKLLKGKGGNPISAARDRAVALHEKIETVRNAPLPTAEAKVKARASLEAAFEHGRPGVANLIEGGFPVEWPRQPVPRPMAVSGGSIAMPSSIDPGIDLGALAVWAMRDQILAAVDGEIDLRGDDEHAIASDERAEREAGLLAELLTVERAEEAAIEVAEAEGMAIARRADADPRAVFGLADSLPYEPEI